jgi:hypothetical protein
VITFKPSKNILLLAAACLFCCCFGTVYAEENNTQNDTITDQTQQPALINTQSETVDKASEEVSQAVTQPVEATPQPPLIDAQPQPSYGPEATDSEAEQETSQAVEQPIEATPQPPLIDAQPKPVYEPESVDSISEDEKDTTTEQSPDPSANKQTITDSTNDENDKSDVEPKEQEIEKTKEQAINWSDTRPGHVNADWLQLTSGEWLRGRIIIMQKDDLEFDSDELKNLVIEWKKVKYIKSSAPYSLRFDGRIEAIGAIEITQDKVHVKTDYDDQTFNRSELQSIASGKETEISKWTNKVTFSINVRRGNTDQTDFTSHINAKRRTIDSRLLLEYLGNFTEVQETETINNHRINATYDVFITRDLFLTLISAEFFRDPFQNIERRRNVGVAIGYTLINTNESEWDISGGPAYQETKFVSVQAGEPLEDTTATVVLSTRFDTELNSIVDLKGTYVVTLGDKKTGNYTHHSLLTIETELTDKLDFDVTMVWDRVKSPVQAEDGSFPEQDDFRILIGLGYDI